MNKETVKGVLEKTLTEVNFLGHTRQMLDREVIDELATAIMELDKPEWRTTTIPIAMAGNCYRSEDQKLAEIWAVPGEYIGKKVTVKIYLEEEE